jgi:hypothetical protein
MFLGVALWVSFASASVSGSFSHGTSVITLVGKDGIVMAADGRTINQSLAGDTGEGANDKIAICGTDFLCGMAGVSPLLITDKGAEVKYNFQDWIPTVKSCHPCSVSQYAKIVQCEARRVLRNVDAVFKIDKYWKSELTERSAFISYQVAGYSDDRPEVCEVPVKIDRKTRTLSYPEPTCIAKAPVKPSPASFTYFPLAPEPTRKH